MQHLDEIELPFLAMGTPDFAANPYAHVAEARKKHPWLAKCENGYCVFDYSAIRELMWMDDKMRPSFDNIVDIMGGSEGSAWGRFTNEQMIALPDREHKLLRDTFARKFTPRFANQMRPQMREIMTALLDEWAPRERIDFEEFSSFYPVSVMSRLIGAPLDAIPGLRHALETLGLGMSLDPAMLPELDRCMIQLDAFCEGLIDARLASPHADDAQDLLDILIEASDQGGISRRQLTDLLIFLYIAGYDTSKNVLTYMMSLMIRHPDIYARCASDHDYCRHVVEESLRMFNPGTSFRFTDADMVYRDIMLPKDTMLFFPLSIAGQDPTVFDDAHRFNPDRPIEAERRQVAFGFGKHMCLGQYIARAQLQEGIHLIAQRMRDPQLTGETGWRPFYGTWGYKGLPIAFTPTPARELEPAG